MNVRFGRTLALAALVGAALPATGRAANGSGPTLGIARPKAVTAPASLDQNWSTRDAAEVMISDADPQPAASAAAGAAASSGVPSAVPSIGWRSPRKATSEGSIQFTQAATTPATEPKAAGAASVVGAEGSLDFDAKLSDAAIAAKAYAEELAVQAAKAEAENAAAKHSAAEQTAAEAKAAIAKAAIAKATLEKAAIEQAAIAKTATITPLPAVEPAKSAIAAGPSIGAIEPHALKDGNIQLAMTKFQDPSVNPADGEESIPAPEVPYNGDKPLRAGDGEPCECMGDACCPPPRPLFWTAGVEATFLSPDLNSLGTGVTIEEFEYDRIDAATSFDDSIDSVYLAPRIWIGVQGCLWGANLRYWSMQAGEASYDPAFGSDGEWDGPGCGIANMGYNSQNQLDAYTVDLEITRRLCIHDCWMQFSAGVRHAEIWQDESVFATGITDDSMMFAFGQANRNTRGTGLLLGWYGRKPIFPCSCVHWFYNFRWAALWGPTQTAAETGVLVGAVTPDAVAAAGSVNGASTYVDDNLFIGEIQLGLEWDYALRCLPANAFFRAAVEYQRWTGGQGYSAADSFAGVSIDDGVNPVEQVALGAAFASADAPVMELVGLSLATGLTW